MSRFVRPSLGLIGQVVTILLLAMLVEFGLNTVLYERASQFSVRDDEGRRLAEHLVIARRLVADATPAERDGLTRKLSTKHYAMAWDRAAPAASDAALEQMRAQVLAWEPALRAGDLRLHLDGGGDGDGDEGGGQAHVAGAIALADGSWLHFRTVEPLDSLDRSGSRILIALAAAIAIMLVGGGLIGRTLRPMRLLADAVDRFGTRVDTGATPPPLVEEGPGEVRRLIAAFNRLQARIGQLIADRTQALAAVGHDIRTPLARLRLRADAVEPATARHEIFGDIDEMDQMVGSLLAFLGGENDPEKPVLADLAVLCATLADDAADHGHTATYVGAAHLDHCFRPLGMKRAVSNLINNALRYGDTVTIGLAVDADTIVLRVEDDGPGIPEADLDRALEPFVRLDSARGRDTLGMGLGLAIVARAVALEGGTLRLSNRPEGGLRAEILLPR